MSLSSILGGSSADPSAYQGALNNLGQYQGTLNQTAQQDSTNANGQQQQSNAYENSMLKYLGQDQNTASNRSSIVGSRLSGEGNSAARTASSSTADLASRGIGNSGSAAGVVSSEANSRAANLASAQASAGEQLQSETNQNMISAYNVANTASNEANAQSNTANSQNLSALNDVSTGEGNFYSTQQKSDDISNAALWQGLLSAGSNGAAA